MRKLKIKNYKKIFTVTEHIISKNFWEFYLIKDKNYTGDIKLAYVLGFENELGPISLDEIRPFIISRTKKLDEVMPPPNSEWVD